MIPDRIRYLLDLIGREIALLCQKRSGKIGSDFSVSTARILG
jgi:hypothetical protein